MGASTRRCVNGSWMIVTTCVGCGCGCDCVRHHWVGVVLLLCACTCGGGGGAGQVDIVQAALRKVFQNMPVAGLLALPDLLPSLAAGLQHPEDSVRDVAAYTTRRILLNLPPLYEELRAAPTPGSGAGAQGGVQVCGCVATWSPLPRGLPI
jgi:hypothetical protein